MEGLYYHGVCGGIDYAAIIVIFLWGGMGEEKKKKPGVECREAQDGWRGKRGMTTLPCATTCLHFTPPKFVFLSLGSPPPSLN